MTPSKHVAWHFFFFSYTVFSKALGVCVNCVPRPRQSLLNLGFHFHIVHQCPPSPPPLLIFPLCARPGHLYQSARPASKEKVSAVDGLAILVIHVMPGGLVGQGAEFSRSSCVLVKLTVRQPKRVSISPLSPRAAPPLLSIGMLGFVPGLTQTHTQPEISVLPSPLPPLNLSPWLYREASIPPDDIGSFFSPCTFRAKEQNKGGERLPFLTL